MAIANLLVKIGADISELKTNSERAAAQMDATASKIDTIAGSIGGRVTGVFSDMGTQIKATAIGFASAEVILGSIGSAFRSLSDFVAESVTSFASAEAASRKLSAALTATGRSGVPEIISQFDKLSTQFQRTTVYSDDLITEMQALLVQVGQVAPGQMNAALKASTDLASGLGIDLRAATLLVAKAFSGGGDELGRLKAILGDAYIAGQGMEGILGAIQKKFGGQASAEIETYAGRLKQLANEWDNVKEAVGKLVVNDPLLVSGLRLTTEAAQNQEAQVSALTVAWNGIKALAPGWVQALGSLYTDLAASADAANTYASNLARATRGVPDFTAVVGKAAGEGRQFGTAFIDVNKVLDAADAAQKKAASAAEAHAKAISDLRAELSGNGAIKAVNDMLAALKGLGPVHNLTADAQKKVNDVVGKAIDVYTAAGKVAPDALRSIYSETLNVTALAPKVGVLSGEWKTLGEVLPIPQMNDLSSKLIYISGITWGAKVGEQIDIVIPKVKEIATVGSELQKALAKIPELLQQAFTGGGNLLGALKAIGVAMADAIVTPLLVGLNKVQKAAISVGTSAATVFGGVTGGGLGAQVAGVAAGLGGAALAASSWGVAMSSAGVAGTVALGAATLGIGAAAVGAAILIKKFTDSKGRKAITEFASSFGGFDALAEKLKLLGAQGEALWVTLTQGTGRGNKAAADAAIAATQAAFKNLSDAIARTGLTWKDLDAAAQASQIRSVAQGLKSDFDTLVAAGFNVTSIVKGQSTALNQLVIDAVETGQKIPAGLQPILTKLIEMGGLTDAAARAMLGLAADTTPSLADITDAAGRYGLSLDALGPKVQQLRISETAAQIVKDFNLLIAAGADVGVIMGAMQQKVQGLVTSALTLGLELPESMRPLIEKMIAAGLLTDDLGGKLTDTSRLKFAKPLTEAIGDLISKLDDLIAKITDNVVPALTGIGRTQIPPVRVPYRYEQEGPNPAAPPGTTPGGSAPSASGRIIAFPSNVTAGGVTAAAASRVADALSAGDGGEYHFYLDGKEIDARVVKVARKDAAQGGLKARAANGRSY